MYRRAIRSLFAATTALLLCATACDKPEEKKADDKKAEPEKADVKAPEPEPQPEPQPEPPQPEVNAEAGADAGAEAGADAGADAGAEGGEPTPAAEEGGEDKPAEDKPAEDKPADKPAEKKPEAAANNINAKPLFDAKCKSCHGADGKGETTIGKKVNIPSLVGTSLSKAKIVSTIENGVPDTKMKGYKDKLSKDEIEALAGYVKKL